MKTVIFTVLVLLFACYPAVAQHSFYTVNVGDNPALTFADSIRFKYPTFVQGTVFYKYGKTAEGYLNYNLVTAEMEFISPDGDTLAISNEVSVKYITIASDTFFYDKAFLQLVDGNANAKLAKKEELKTGDIKREGGYGTVSSTSAITTYSTLTTNGEMRDLTQRQQITLVKTTAYYIGDTYNHFIPANKKNFLKLFNKNQNAAEQYLKDNKTAFNNETDLKAAISFMNK